MDRYDFVCVCVRVRACVRACMRACVRACVRGGGRTGGRAGRWAGGRAQFYVWQHVIPGKNHLRKVGYDTRVHVCEQACVHSFVRAFMRAFSRVRV